MNTNSNHQLDRLYFAPNSQGLIGAYMSKNDPDFAFWGVGDPAPEPSGVLLGGLGLLACGAQGLRELRRRRATTREN